MPQNLGLHGQKISKSVRTKADFLIFWVSRAGLFSGFGCVSGAWGHHFKANFRAAAQSKYSASRVSSARHFAFASCAWKICDLLYGSDLVSSMSGLSSAIAASTHDNEQWAKYI